MSFTHINVRPTLPPRQPVHHSSPGPPLSLQVSKENYCFSDYPFPEGTPDYPHHTQMAAYVNSYVDHYDLRKHVAFNTTVTRLTRGDGGKGWVVEAETNRGVGGVSRRRFTARHVAIATGHHAAPSHPDFPGLKDKFQGRAEHSVHYNDAEYNEVQSRRVN